MVVGANVQRRPFLLAVDQERSGLLAAFVAAGGFARAHRREQAAREGQAVIGDVGLGGLVEHVGTREHVAGDGEAAARDVAAPVDAVAPGVRSNLAARVHDVDLAAFAPVVGREQAGEYVMRVQAFTQELDAVDAVIGIHEGLGCDRAEAGGDIGHARADGEEAGRNRDAELAGGRIACDDRPGHILSISVLLRSLACRADWRRRGGVPRRARPR
ncbi:hypothetical protein ABIE71_004445 [Bradyrhizobium diazoefficiens]